MRTLLALAAVVGAGALAALPLRVYADASIVVDGDFETPSTGGTQATYTAGQTFGGPSNQAWMVTGDSIDLCGCGWQDAEPSGTQQVDLNGNNTGGVYQDLPTAAGHTYTLSFWYAGNTACTPTVKTLSVRWAGTQIAAPSFDTTGHDSTTNMGWTNAHYTVSASANTSRLEFDSTTPSSACGPTLDDVSVVPGPSSATPEVPLTAPLLLLGGVTLGAARLVRRRGSRPTE